MNEIIAAIAAVLIFFGMLIGASLWEGQRTREAILECQKNDVTIAECQTSLK